jgi:hypothetical protein
MTACLDITGNLKGIQLAVAIIKDGVPTDKVQLAQFGDIKPPICYYFTFSDTLSLTKLEFFYSPK